MAGWDSTLFGNLPQRPRRPGQQRSGPLNAQDIVNGVAGRPQEARGYDDPTISGQLQQTFERGAERAGAPMWVQRGAGDIGAFLGGATGLDMPQHLSDAWNYLRHGAYGQAAGSALAAVPVLPGAAGARAAARTAEEAATGAAKSGITAYHGSPYSFDRFDTSKIGTGEGAQAYGHGLYFAGNEDVAKNYRNQLAPGYVMADGSPVSNATYSALSFVQPKYEQSGQLAEGIQDAISRLKNQSEFYRKQYGSGVNLYDNAVDTLQNLDPATLKPAGHMYQVNINANPNRFIDWDKPMNEQHPDVQAVLGSSNETAAGQLGRAYRNPMFAGDLIGQDRATPDELSAALAKKGIPGIKYLDQGSRGAGGEGGTQNYVTFSDDIIDILKKYGLAGLGLTAGAGALSASGQSPVSSPAEAAPPPQGMTLGAQPNWSP